MRVAIVSDIHANWQAWCAVRDDFTRRRVDTVICLGDIVGYGPNPVETLADVRSVCANIVLGNHDAAAAGIADLEIFSERARRSAEWTATQLPGDAIGALFDLPLTIENDDALFTHADCAAPEQWGYVETVGDARKNFDAVAHRFVFLGHTHFPEVFALGPDGMISESRPETLRLESGSRYIINVGSVGDPRDETEFASYAIFDEEAQRVEFYKIEFNTDAFAKAVAAQPALEAPWFLRRRGHESAAGERDHAIRTIKAPANSIRVKARRMTLQVNTDELHAMTTSVLTKKISAANETRVRKKVKSRKWLIATVAASIVVAVGFFVVQIIRAPPARIAAVPATNAPVQMVASAPPPVIASNAEFTKVLTVQEAKITKALKLQVGGGITNIGYWNSTRSYVSWQFTAPQPGICDVAISYSLAPFAAGTPYFVECGTSKISSVARSTGAWENFTTTHIGRISLAAGPATLTVRADGNIHGGLLNLEKVILHTPAAEPRPAR